MCAGGQKVKELLEFHFQSSPVPLSAGRDSVGLDSIGPYSVGLDPIGLDSVGLEGSPHAALARHDGASGAFSGGLGGSAGQGGMLAIRDDGTASDGLKKLLGSKVARCLDIVAPLDRVVL